MDHGISLPADSGYPFSGIMDCLRELNVKSVYKQYGGDPLAMDMEIKDLLRNKNKSKPLSLHGLYNAIRCLRYQIEEEDMTLSNIEKQSLSFLDQLAYIIANKIIMDLPDDKTNVWSIEE